MQDNYARMIQLVTEFFDVRNDPEQLNVDETVIARLQKMHPATMSEVTDEKGPIVWLLLIPTTQQIMEEFLTGRLTEKQLYEQTPLAVPYDALYLCSVSVLPEYRHRGLAKKTAVDAIHNIRVDNPVQTLFYWPFSEEGRGLAHAIANEVHLPLLERAHVG
jgi:hypothetical protein